MSSAEIGFIGFIVLLIFVFAGIHIGFSLIVVGLLGCLAIGGLGFALSTANIVPFTIISDASFAVVPLFLLMSDFVSTSGIGRQAYETARTWLGHIKGGLAMATVGGCALFAAVSGSSMATAVMMGKIAYPEMKRYNYSSELSAGCISSGGTLGIMIPPSVAFVMIGILTEVSIGKLFIAGILPGITQAILYIATIWIMCKIKPDLAPIAPSTSQKEKITSLRLIWPIAVLFFLVMGGLYAGIFTGTEAGAIGAFGALVLAVLRRQMSKKDFTSSLQNTVQTSAMILLLLVGAFVFNRFMAISRIPFIASVLIADLGINRYIILAIILIFYIIMGMFLDIMSIIILTVPFLFPTILALNFDPIWYGVLMCRVVEMGFISPPYGINLFVLVGVTGIPLGVMYRGVIPFLIADIVHLILLVIVPAFSLFLPNMM